LPAPKNKKLKKYGAISAKRKQMSFACKELLEGFSEMKVEMEKNGSKYWEW